MADSVAILAVLAVGVCVVVFICSHIAAWVWFKKKLDYLARVRSHFSN